MCDTATIQARIRQKKSVPGALEPKPEVEIWRRPVFLTFFISRVLFSPPSPTSELRDCQLCGVVVNRLQIVIMDYMAHGLLLSAATGF